MVDSRVLERMIARMESLAELFRKTDRAFEKSDVKKLAENQGKRWNYSISSTKLSINSTLIIGFNWGAAQGKSYEPQVKIPPESFGELYEKKWLGSLQRVYQPLKEYFSSENIENSIQTNFCFFRSKSEDQISEFDLELSKPLFDELLANLKPKRIIGFSAKLKNYLTESRLCVQYEDVNIQSNTRTLNAAKALYKSNELIPIYFLPHPNAKFTTEARRSAWDYCFSNGDRI